jgi:biopolymer transport protein ExbD
MAGGTTSYEDDDSGGAPIVDINVTPLVDIVLVLLIIFMVTAKLIAGRAVTVESPKAVSGETVQSTLAITIDAQGNLYVNNAVQSDPARIAEFVKKAVAANPEVQAVITADTRVPHGRVMEMIDLVKLSGVKRFGMTVEEKKQP